MHSKKKTVVIVLLFILAIVGLRLFVVSFQKPVAQPYAADGVMDLRGWTIPHHRTITLNGQWDFFPNRLMTPGAITDSSDPGRTVIQVPGAWESYFPERGTSSYLYGTYRLRIMLDDTVHEVFQLRTKEINNASAVYINGQFVAGAGTPSDDKNMYQARDLPYFIPVPPNSSVIDIIIQVSNHAGQGGITKSIQFGTLEAVNRWTFLSIGLQSLLGVVLFVHGLYAFMLYFLGGANKGLLYFSLVILCAIVSVLVADDKLLLQWLPMPYEAAIKISLLSYIGVVAFMPPLLKHMFPEYGSARIVRWFAYYCSAYSIFVVAAPTAYSIPTIRIFLLAVLLLAVLISGYILQLAIRHQDDVIYLLLSCVSLGVNIGWTVINSRAALEMMHYPFDLIITVLAFAAFWFKRFFRSVDQTKQLAEKLRRANQQKDDFLVNTSHELRNPLHGIMNIAQSVLDDTVNPAPETHRTRLETQVAVAKRMSLLLDDLLDMARLKERNMRLQIGNIHLQSVIAGSVELIRYMLDGKPIRLHVDIDNHFPAVMADENRLVQILFNLLHNAVKFTNEGEICISARLVDNAARIEIKDTGIGMDEETQRIIFLPYEQGKLNMAAAYGGFGLGLSICKWLIELHGGDLQVESSPGQGSVFSFTLPLSEQPEPADPYDPVRYSPPLTDLVFHTESAPAHERTQTVSASTSPVADKPSLLVVDDDSVNLRILTDMLGAEYEITTATSATDALNKMREASFDLLILDVMMPHISGYELTRAIREQYSVSELPILLLTARSRSEDIITGFQSGANDYIAKPAEPWELKSRVRALTGLKLSIEKRLQIEAAWLQAQIQPHFLFNTLNTIIALSTMDITRMKELFEHFVGYLRASFDFHNSDKVVSIERELALVRHYVFIEKERFGERLHVEWDIDADLNFSLPPLTIQTLVENAINHGIIRRSRGGTVQVAIRKKGDSIEVSIRDNGVGMSEEKLQRLFTEQDIRDGVGIRNTDRRLKQFYGKGLHIESIPNEGTNVTFHIPA